MQEYSNAIKIIKNHVFGDGSKTEGHGEAIHNLRVQVRELCAIRYS